MTTIQAGLTYYKQVNEKVREAAGKGTTASRSKT